MKLNLQFFGGRGTPSASFKQNSLAGIRQGKEATPEEAVQNVNAERYNDSWTYRQNCQRCVWAYEMQRRGYDVEALPTYKGDDLPSNGNWLGIIDGTVTRKYIAADVWAGQKNTIKTEVANATNIMQGWGEGSRGIVRVAWGSRNGHVFNVEYKNGKITAYDAQNGKTYTNFAEALKGTKRGYAQIVRTDNVTFKTSEVSKYVKERGKK